MAFAVLIVLLAVGFTLVGLELFITPGFILGIIGLLFLAGGIWMSYNTYGTNSGHITLASVLSLLSLGIVFTLRSGFWKRVALHDQILGKANNSDRYDVVPGNTGSTLSALRPSGTAIINGNKYEVHSSGEFIDSNQEVEVTQINNHKIFVKPKT